MLRLFTLIVVAALAVGCSSAAVVQPTTTPAPAQSTTADPVQPTATPTVATPVPTIISTATPTVAPTATAQPAAHSITGIWVDKAQPETVQVELTESGEILFRMRTKSTIQGQAPTYGEWNTVATLIWKQAGPDSIELTSGDKHETWKVDWSRPALLQPKSDGSGTIEFIRP